MSLGGTGLLANAITLNHLVGEGGTRVSAASLYFMYRDWDPHSGTGIDGIASQDAKKVLSEFLKNVQRYLEVPLGDKDFVQRQYYLNRVYKCLSTMSVLNENLGKAVGYSKGGEGGMSRPNQYLRYLTQSFEELRVIRDLRSPNGLRYMTAFFVYTLPVLLAPSFSALESDPFLLSVGSYYAATLYTVITTSLYNVQIGLEDPFDNVGADNLELTLEEDLGSFLTSAPFLTDPESKRINVAYDESQQMKKVNPTESSSYSATIESDELNKKQKDKKQKSKKKRSRAKGNKGVGKKKRSTRMDDD
eukprot:gene3735-4675_t